MYEQIRANQRRAALLVIGMALLMVAMGWALAEYAAPGAGIYGIFFAGILWFVHSLISYFAGSNIILSLSGARKISKSDHPVLFNVVEEMCVASGLSRVPEIYIIDDEALNAFATGRDPEHAVVAVTSGLLKELTRDELQGVIAHEISHVNNRDVLYMMMLAVMMGTIIFLAEIGRRSMFRGSGSRTGGRKRGSGGGAAGILLLVAILLMILAPVLARLLYLAVSRKREYLADASGSLYTRYPEGLAAALVKLGGSTRKLRTASPALAPMYIVNPLNVTASGLADISSTHPPLSERVRILRSMGGGAGLKSYNEAFRKVTGRPVGLIPFASLRDSREVAVVTPPSPPVVLPISGATGDTALEHIDRVRTTTDLLWTLNQYSFIDCPCETKLKIPPAYAGKKIECPHCSRVHSVPAAA